MHLNEELNSLRWYYRRRRAGKPGRRHRMPPQPHATPP